MAVSNFNDFLKSHIGYLGFKIFFRILLMGALFAERNFLTIVRCRFINIGNIKIEEFYVASAVNYLYG